MEIGGLNSVIPLLTGALLDLPTIDGDFMGRAFPSLTMTTYCMKKIKYPPFPIFVATENEKEDVYIAD